MEKLTWLNARRKINDLIPYEQNPRQMTEKQAEDLQKSIEKFDLVEIPAIDLDNKIVAGHQRLKILQLLGRGEEEIDVRIPSRKLTDEEFREYLLRSNKNVGEWDWNVLANFDSELLKDIGFSVNDFGLNIDKFGEDFSLNSGDKPPFQQMTFTLADQQAEIVQEALASAKILDVGIDNYGNENSNGNALFLIVKEWTELKK